MPSLAIVTGLTSCQSVVPQIVWSQDHQTVFLRVTITYMRDITHGQVVVGVKDQELTVQVLEVNVSQTGPVRRGTGSLILPGTWRLTRQ